MPFVNYNRTCGGLEKTPLSFFRCKSKAVIPFQWIWWINGWVGPGSEKVKGPIHVPWWSSTDFTTGTCSEKGWKDWSYFFTVRGVSGKVCLWEVLGYNCACGVEKCRRLENSSWGRELWPLRRSSWSPCLSTLQGLLQCNTLTCSVQILSLSQWPSPGTGFPSPWVCMVEKLAMAVRYWWNYPACYQTGWIFHLFLHFLLPVSFSNLASAGCRLLQT